MKLSLTRLSIPLLRWTISIVVIIESVQFILSPAAAHLFLKLGVPAWVRPALGISEILATILFVVPATTIVGASLLLVIFALAAMVHLLHGQYGVSGLVVYAVAVLACMANRSSATTEVSDE